MKKTHKWVLVPVVMVFFMFFTTSCAKKIAQVETAEVTAPPEVSEAVDSSQEDEALAAQLQEEQQRAEEDARKAAETAFVEEKVHFAFNSFVLSNQAVALLNKKADYLRSNPGIRISVEGHCDERGDDAYNLALGQRRAESVKTFLVNMGVEAVRVNTVSFGETRPIAAGRDEASWARNRRAEFVIN